jgi:hypothetical protein
MIIVKKRYIQIENVHAEMPNGLTSKQKILLDDLIDKCYVMSILCERSSSYFNTIKFMINFTLVIVNSSMTIFNSYFKINCNDTDKYITILNISSNATSTVLVSLLVTLKIVEKCFTFSTMSHKFQKLENQLQNELSNNLELTNEAIKNFLNLYDTYCENTTYVFPQWIRQAVREEYKNIRTLPVCINGIKKMDCYRRESIYTDDMIPPFNNRKQSTDEWSTSNELSFKNKDIFDGIYSHHHHSTNRSSPINSAKSCPIYELSSFKKRENTSSAHSIDDDDDLNRSASENTLTLHNSWQMDYKNEITSRQESLSIFEKNTNSAEELRKELMDKFQNQKQNDDMDKITECTEGDSLTPTSKNKPSRSLSLQSTKSSHHESPNVLLCTKEYPEDEEDDI